jgi:DNA-binding Lrp family transcriptional regulator
MKAFDAAQPQLDTYDRRLLALLQENAGRTAEELAAQVPLSVSAIQRRVKRLREDGIIQRDIAVLDPAAVGGVTMFLASLQLAREHLQGTQRLRDWLVSCPAVQQAYYVTGDSDFVLVVCARDVAQYEALMGRLMAENPDVLRYETRVALSQVKRGLSVPVD